MWLGLIPTVLIWPAQTIPTGLVGLTLILPAALWGKFKLGFPHLLLLAFFAYAIASLGWSYDQKWYGLWILLPTAIGLMLGSSRDQRKIWMGIAIGLGISSTVAIAQQWGLEWPFTSTGTPSGLYYNPSLHGWVLALAIVGLVSMRMWPWALPLLPGLWLSHSRGAWAILAFGLLASPVRKPLVLLVIVLGAATWVMSGLYRNDVQRIETWYYAVSLFTPFGNGIGSFMELLYFDADRLWHPYHVHNDYLQLLFEFGIGALPLFAAWIWVAMYTEHDLWPLHLSCLFLACFAFPFYTPITAFIWALACGGIMRKDHEN